MSELPEGIDPEIFEDLHTSLSGLSLCFVINRPSELWEILQLVKSDRAMVRGEITTGRHVPPDGWSLFMNGFFHSTEDLQSETRQAGFEIRTLAAIEGPAWMSQDFDIAWEDPHKRHRILELSRLAEQDMSIIAASPHVAFVAKAAGLECESDDAANA